MNGIQGQKSCFGKFLLLWSGELISAIGGGLSSFGLGVYVFNKTGSAAAMALITLIAFLPSLLLSAPAGVLADRYDRRLMMMLGDGCSALGLIFILVCMLRGDAALWQICAGVGISSVFSSLLEPAFKATITDLLSPEEYSKASGMVNIAGSSRYLISPILAGILLSVADIKLLLLLDILTFIPTVLAAWVVRKGLPAKKTEEHTTFLESFREGWQAISRNRGILAIVFLGSGICFFMGFLQTLSEPLILAFSNSATLGVSETVCASGMLVSSVFLGIFGIRKNYVKVLSVSLFLAGAGMVGFGCKEKIIWICCFGFLFFLMLPFANSSLDYLIRTNIADELQGRAWGLIGLISQIGYVIAYATAGLLADGIGRTAKIGVGRGAAIVIVAAGVFLSVLAVLIYTRKEVRELERKV